MTSLPTAAAILAAADLPASHKDQAQALLDQFATLPPKERETERATFAARGFSLFFGENAAIDGSPDYEAQRQVQWASHCWLRPRVVVRPTSAQEVSTALSLCRFFDMTFSIRGGGHFHAPGFTSNDGGVVISTAAFDHVHLSDDQTRADVGVGLRWMQVYQALEPFGLAVTGGRIPTVGVPGLILGGGISFRHDEEGLGAAGVSNYEVVLASGEIVRANEGENSDLFWALKGGGPNFGIVTKIEMKTVRTRHWSEVKVYSHAAMTDLFRALIQYQEAMERDDKSSLIFTVTGDGVLLIAFYGDPVDSLPEVFEPFRHIPFTSYLVEPGVRSTCELVEGIKNVTSTEYICHEMRTFSSRPSMEVYEAAEQARQEQVEALSDVEGMRMLAAIQPFSSQGIKRTNQCGNALGLAEVGQQWFVIVADWEHAADGDRVRGAVRHIIDVAERTAKETGTYLPFLYSNYASLDQDPIAGYGAENVARLKAVAAKYDPDGVFQTLQNGGWLLSKVRSG